GFMGNISYLMTETVKLSGAGVAGAGAINNLGGSNSFVGPITVNSASTVGSAAGVLTLNGTITANATLSTAGAGDLAVATVIKGTGGLTKNGNGTVTLSAANTYTGATKVNAGVLLVNGSQPSSAVTVAAGGNLCGSGQVGNATGTGGTIDPGAGPVFGT